MYRLETLLIHKRWCLVGIKGRVDQHRSSGGETCRGLDPRLFSLAIRGNSTDSAFGGRWTAHLADLIPHFKTTQKRDVEHHGE